MLKSGTNDRRTLRVERLEDRLVLSGQTWNLAADFAADFSMELPQHNPNGTWTYLAPDGSAGSLESTNGAATPPGPNTFGVGAGWAHSSGVPSYARGGVFGFPSETMAGHGPNRIEWTAPAGITTGGVELTGLFTQADFEPLRQMQLQIFKYDAATPLIAVEASFENQRATIPLPVTQVAIVPGDRLSILVDGNGPQGNGIATFSAWNVVIAEVVLPGDYNSNGVVDAADYTVWRDHFETTGDVGTVPGDGTTSENLDGVPDGLVDQWDYSLWKQVFGNAFDSGGDNFGYHPAAIIVQSDGVSLPDGSLLDTSSSQTHGLQEAFDFSAEQGWDVFVLPGTYDLDASLDVEEIQGRAFRLKDVTLNFSSSVTTFGIRFDSTMITDWYWRGGALNAPHALHGVLFQPRTPHPLDGPKFGTIGVVDSRFDFGMDITAGVYKVTMNTLMAAVNDVAFHFKNAPRNEFHLIGGGFSPTNIFARARTDDPIPFDLFETAGRVTVVPPPTDISSGLPAQVFKPDGSKLELTGTQTFGLQEAFDFADTNDLEVLVFGRGVRNVAPFTNLGLYNLAAGLAVGRLDSRLYRMYSVTLNYTGSGTAISMSDITESDFELTGQIVGVTAGVGVHIQPTDDGVVDSTIRIQHVVGSDTNVLIDPGLATVRNTEFYLHEMNIGDFGIVITNPSSTTEFSNNFIRTLHTHAMTQIGVQLGQNGTNASSILGNTIEMRTNTDGGPSVAALQVWGDMNAFDIIALGPRLSFGAKFEAGSNDNNVLFGPIQATTPISDAGTNNQFISNAIGLELRSPSTDREISSGPTFLRIEATAKVGDASHPPHDVGRRSRLLGIIDRLQAGTTDPGTNSVWNSDVDWPYVTDHAFAEYGLEIESRLAVV